MKEFFCVIRPRKRVTGWTNVSGDVWSSPFTLSESITRVFSSIGINDNFTELTKVSGTPTTDEEYSFDGENILLFSFSDPDSYSFPGVTVEFELFLADHDQTLNADPLDTTSEIVDWEGVLVDIPTVQNGNSDALYGVAPLVVGSIKVLNQEGVFNEILNDCSFNNAPCEAWVKDGLSIKKVFLGFVTGFTMSDTGTLDFRCADYMSVLDKQYDMEINAGPRVTVLTNFEEGFFPNAEPNAIDEEWYKRRLFGRVDGHVPVNIDYQETPATNKNRDWVTHFHDDDTEQVATVVQSVNSAGTNTNTLTSIVGTPLFNEGDFVEIVNNSVTYRRTIVDVNRTSNYITHDPIVGRTITGSDTVTRYFVARVDIEDEDGQVFNLEPTRDYTVFVDNTTKTAGFNLVDNFEPNFSFPGGIFNPLVHKIVARVYGSKNLDEYSDATDVGTVSPRGGNRGLAHQHIYRLLVEAGIKPEQIDKTSFETIGADSHSLGFCVPATVNELTTPTYRELIQECLGSMLWTLGFTQVGNDLKIGLSAYQPFVASADYTASSEDIQSFQFEVDYRDVYSDFNLTYAKKEKELSLFFRDVDLRARQKTLTIFANSRMAYELHFVKKTFEKTSLHYSTAEAQTLLDRLVYALGERRGIYRITLGQEFLESTNLGASYDIQREHLPGFTYQRGTDRTRQTSLIEVQKSATGVSISLDDQKGIQDNSGNW